MLSCEQLLSIGILQDSDQKMLARLIADRQIYTDSHSKGKTVHHQGATCRTLDIVLSGKLVAYSLFDNGSAVTMFEFSEGSVIGANLLLGDNHIYPLNIYTISACELLHIATEAVLELLHGYSFTLSFVKALSQNSQGINTKLAMYTQKTLRENILDYLRQQSIIQKSTEVVLPVSKKELADRLGVQRPSLFREFKQLRDEGIIEFKNRSVKLIRHD
jgi:CRP-like cAMP-binding protein